MKGSQLAHHIRLPRLSWLFELANGTSSTSNIFNLNHFYFMNFVNFNYIFYCFSNSVLSRPLVNLLNSTTTQKNRYFHNVNL